MAQESVLLARLVGLLSMPGVQRIGFRLGPYSVSGADYAAIRTALFYGKVGVSINPRLLQKLNAGAAYIDKSFVFASAGFGLTLTDEMAIVHECTHAVNDMHGFRWTETDTEDEATAFIAGALYCFHATGPLKRELTPDPIFATTGEPFKTAFSIAEKLIYGPANQVVPVQDAIVLRTKIIGHPTYAAMGVTLGTRAVKHSKW
jgi:hypothetical protein